MFDSQLCRRNSSSSLDWNSFKIRMVLELVGSRGTTLCSGHHLTEYEEFPIPLFAQVALVLF